MIIMSSGSDGGVGTAGVSQGWLSTIGRHVKPVCEPQSWPSRVCSPSMQADHSPVLQMLHSSGGDVATIENVDKPGDMPT